MIGKYFLNIDSEKCINFVKRYWEMAHFLMFFLGNIDIDGSIGKYNINKIFIYRTFCFIRKASNLGRLYKESSVNISSEKKDFIEPFVFL